MQVPPEVTSDLTRRLLLSDLDPATAKLAIVMSWYPKLPVEKFPYIIAYAPTEPFLIPKVDSNSWRSGCNSCSVVWIG
ncbi:hypothetical protein CRYUN_Cryun13aG0056100 [Craigia yunnanensis]